MDRADAKRKMAEGDRLLEDVIGNVPIAYALVCELPAAHGEPLERLNRVWYDKFEARHRDWMAILNGMEGPYESPKLGLTIPAGAGVIVCDGTRLATLTPLGVTWITDPDTGTRFEAEEEMDYWDRLVIGALHDRLTEKGKDLQELDQYVSRVG